MDLFILVRQSFPITLNSVFESVQFSKCKTLVTIRGFRGWVYRYNFVKTVYRFFIVAYAEKEDPFII